MNKFRDNTPSRSSKTVENYKDAFADLRVDFDERCGYCDVSDRYITINYFEIDHYKPQSKFENLKHTYSNLIYSCKNCNNFKSSYWATDNEENSLNSDKTEGLIDPCTIEYTELFERNDNGYIIPKDNPVSEFIYKRLKLYLFKKAFYYKIEQIDKKICAILKHNDFCNIESEDSRMLLEMKTKNQNLVNKVELAYKLKK